ncbi:NAD(P)-dependent oxidoreductase [Streptomyces maremycinicus]|nr:NAD(P)-dependent oxidoreductase [Streptomyces sp. B9173]
MFLITTAGKVGAETARLLAQRSEPVRVLVRNHEKAAALTQAGIEVVQGDLKDPQTVDAAMRGVAAVVLVSPAVPHQELNVVASAVRAGVKHVVKITSESSTDSPIARRRGQAEIENELIASGLGYTLLKNNAYMQNLLMLAPAIAAANSFGSSTGDGRIGMIDTRDVAALAAEIVASPDPHRGKTYWPTGPETLSYPDVATVLSNLLDRPISFRPLTFDQQRQAMIDAGLPVHVAEDNAQALRLFAEGEADYTTGDVQSILARPPRTFEQFATDHAAAFS